MRLCAFGTLVLCLMLALFAPAYALPIATPLPNAVFVSSSPPQAPERLAQVNAGVNTLDTLAPNATTFAASPSPCPEDQFDTCVPEAVQKEIGFLRTSCATQAKAGGLFHEIAKLVQSVYNIVTLQTLSAQIAFHSGSIALNVLTLLFGLSMIGMMREVREKAKAPSLRILLEIPTVRIVGFLLAILIIGVLSGHGVINGPSATGNNGGALAASLPDSGMHLAGVLIPEAAIQRQMQRDGWFTAIEPVPEDAGTIGADAVCSAAKNIVLPFTFASRLDVVQNAGWTSAVVAAIFGLILLIINSVPLAAVFLSLLILLFKKIVLGINGGLIAAIGIISLGFVGHDKTKKYSQAYYDTLVRLFVTGLVFGAVLFLVLNIFQLSESQLSGALTSDAKGIPFSSSVQFIVQNWLYASLALALAYSVEKFVDQLLSGQLGLSGASLLGGLASAAALATGAGALIKGALNSKNSIQPDSNPANGAGSGGANGGGTPNPNPTTLPAPSDPKLDSLPPPKDVPPSGSVSTPPIDSPAIPSDVPVPPSESNTPNAPEKGDTAPPNASDEQEPGEANPSSLGQRLREGLTVAGGAAAIGLSLRRARLLPGQALRKLDGVSPLAGRAARFAGRVGKSVADEAINGSFIRHAGRILHAGASGTHTTAGHHFGANAPKRGGASLGGASATAPGTPTAAERAEAQTQGRAAQEQLQDEDTFFGASAPVAQTIAGLAASGLAAQANGNHRAAGGDYLAAAHIAQAQVRTSTGAQAAGFSRSAARLRLAGDALSGTRVAPALASLRGARPQEYRAIAHPFIPSQSREQLLTTLQSVRALAPRTTVQNARAAARLDVAVAALASPTTPVRDVRALLSSAQQAMIDARNDDRAAGHANADVWETLATSIAPYTGAAPVEPPPVAPEPAPI